MASVFNFPGTLSLDFLGNNQFNKAGLTTSTANTGSQQMYISTVVPKQRLQLMSIRAEFDTSASALLTGVIYVYLPIYNQNSLIDANPNYFMLPILVDNAQVTVRDTILKNIWMSIYLDKSFTMSVYYMANATTMGSTTGLTPGSFYPLTSSAFGNGQGLYRLTLVFNTESQQIS